MEPKIRIPDSIEFRLDSYMEGRVYPTEIATTFNYVIKDEFERVGLKPVFVGEYFIDYLKPTKIRVLCHQGTEACSPITTERGGVIWRAIRTGQDQYVPDVTKDKDHVGCDPKMEGSELVLLSWSDPYKNIELGGHSIPLGVLDLDLNVKDTLQIEDIKRLRKIWSKYGKMVFSGSPCFMPGANIKISQCEPTTHILSYSGAQYRYFS